MTDEDAFQNALDADPGHWGLRLVFSDFLEERNDPRALGMRALGQLRMWPVRLRPVPDNPTCDHWMFQLLPVLLSRSSDAFRRCTFDSEDADMKAWFREFCPHVFGSHYRSRQAAEDAAAHGFARLDARTQQDILIRNAVIHSKPQKERVK